MAGPAPSPHKPRRRAKKDGDVYVPHPKTEALVRTPSFPLAAILWPARGSTSQWELLPLILMMAGLFRWAAGLWGYSGFQKPPMFGDYEAQRHWMELTIHLPISQWYFHDLEWWGLDYPPLTAYHSWLCGKIGALIDPSWFGLYTSRGSDDPTLKIFMRTTVLVSEYLIYIPAVVVFVRRFSRLNAVPSWTSSVALTAILMQPGLILIDHAHFQYNTVMLGLVLASVNSMLAGRYSWASVFFVAALGFKQMALYYAFSVFAYLLGNCVFPRINVTRFLAIAVVTAASFAILILPLIIGALVGSRGGLDSKPEQDEPQPLPIFAALGAYLDTKAFYYPVVAQLAQMIHRVFPFARGIFEDKVANFWCAANLVVKLRHYPQELLQKASLGLTLLSIIPPNAILFFRPAKTLLPLAFAATAWGFFLFSFQVHEKSVLLPLMPMTVMLAGADGLGMEIRSWVGFANLLGVWTMLPLLKRVYLGVPTAVFTFLWVYLLGFIPVEGAKSVEQQITTIIHWLFYLAMAVWCVCDAAVAPPLGKPDLWVVVNVAIGAAGFSLCYLWCMWRLVIASDIIPRSRDSKGKAKSKTQ